MLGACVVTSISVLAPIFKRSIPGCQGKALAARFWRCTSSRSVPQAPAAGAVAPPSSLVDGTLLVELRQEIARRLGVVWAAAVHGIACPFAGGGPAAH